MRNAALLVALIVLTSCSTNVTRSDYSEVQFQKDKAECEYEAKRGAVGHTGFTALKERELMIECLKLRGYRVT